METYEVAHLREQGQDIIIVAVAPRFGQLGSAQQNRVTSALQLAATSAGLAGTVVPVWDGGGRMSFLAPRPWYPFFRSMTLADVAANINRTLTIE